MFALATVVLALDECLGLDCALVYVLFALFTFARGLLAFRILWLLCFVGFVRCWCVGLMCCVYFGCCCLRTFGSFDSWFVSSNCLFARRFGLCDCFCCRIGIRFDIVCGLICLLSLLFGLAAYL